ncbi:MAG: hypothetical protein ACLFQK_10480, partial [Fibrobacterota bacterium]
YGFFSHELENTPYRISLSASWPGFGETRAHKKKDMPSGKEKESPANDSAFIDSPAGPDLDSLFMQSTDSPALKGRNIRIIRKSGSRKDQLPEKEEEGLEESPKGIVGRKARYKRRSILEETEKKDSTDSE